MEKMSPTASLHAAVAAIPDGEVSETARAAGLALTQLLRLRRGENLDIKISTLVRLAQAMGKSADELLGLESPPPNAGAEAALRRVDQMMEDRRKQLEKEQAEVARQLERLAALKRKN